MIKKRLIQLLSHAKKYILLQVLWKWLSLLCQVVMVFQISMLLEEAFLRRNLVDGRNCGDCHGIPIFL